LHQHRNQQIEPVADDIGSFALDLLVREKGFHRTAINPMMVIS
jgi:formate dehydrogenase maturation protein FdhE